MDVLLKNSYLTTADLLAAVPADRWDAPSPCAAWTVREVVGHLVESMDYFATAVSGRPGDLPADPVDAYRAVADRCLAAFTPVALTATHAFPGGDVPGWVIANISLSESLVHGWDVATGAGLPFTPPADAVAALLEFGEGEGVAPEGAFADPVPVSADAPPLVRLLARMGREAR